MVVGDDDDGNPILVEAAPPYALCVKQGSPVQEVYRRMLDGNDPGGLAWIGMRIGMDPHYLRGFLDGYFGQVPDYEFSEERQGWRDGSACRRDLFENA